MVRSYYVAKITDFLLQSDNEILGTLTKNNQFNLNDLQRNTWIQEISILKESLRGMHVGTIIFEYTIPRIGSRVDVVLIINNQVFILEFKCGDSTYSSYALDQVLDYALDLKNFHSASLNVRLIPILIATNASTIDNQYESYEDDIAKPIKCNKKSLKFELERLSALSEITSVIDVNAWINSPYMPTPTIIEAAQALYSNHDVKEISRSDATAMNLSITASAIDKIITYSKSNKKKSICFVTGVPGAGKTLAGLNIACSRHIHEEEHAVFLSGNAPLVDVLQEALARDDVKKNNVKKGDAIRKAKSFIQIIHHFRDDALTTYDAPIEKVAIFDEAQRAWDCRQTSKFMQTKKGVPDFNMSEPEFLINIMDRHEYWAVVVCLIGGGQEINIGEAGITEWFSALKTKFTHWDVFLSKNITDSEYSKEGNIEKEIEGIQNYQFVDGLHLGVSLRSFRSEKLAAFVKALLDMQKEEAKAVFEELSMNYPIRITRNLDLAKKWVKSKARGTERYGIIASSGARRLRSQGIWIQSKIDAINWFLNGKDDVRSSFYLEDTATEFDIQGLELDYAIVAWDANLRLEDDVFKYYNFSGTKWQNMHSETDKHYLKNAYRVLLTRARQGFVIYVPEGDVNDKTCNPEFYNNVYLYFKSLGVKELY